VGVVLRNISHSARDSSPAQNTKFQSHLGSLQREKELQMLSHTPFSTAAENLKSRFSVEILNISPSVLSSGPGICDMLSSHAVALLS
jgi:hypothetical protein